MNRKTFNALLGVALLGASLGLGTQAHAQAQVQVQDKPIIKLLVGFPPGGAADNLARLSNPPDLATPCTLERHGSSTAGEPKFSMAVELQDDNGVDQRCSPLGMPAEADWLMHAPYFYDRAMMHNDLMYRTSNEMGRYAPRTRFVEVYLVTRGSAPLDTGNYMGVYILEERIELGNDRVDVERVKPGASVPPEVTGGYLFKIDRSGGDDGFIWRPKWIGGRLWDNRCFAPDHRWHCDVAVCIFKFVVPYPYGQLFVFTQRH